LGGDKWGITVSFAEPFLFTKYAANSVPRLEEHLQTVNFRDADIANGADFAGAEELDRTRSGIEIVLEGDDGRIMEKAAVRLKDDQIDRIRPEHHGLGCGEMYGIHYSAIF